MPNLKRELKLSVKVCEGFFLAKAHTCSKEKAPYEFSHDDLLLLHEPLDNVVKNLVGFPSGKPVDLSTEVLPLSKLTILSSKAHPPTHFS